MSVYFRVDGNSEIDPRSPLTSLSDTPPGKKEDVEKENDKITEEEFRQKREEMMKRNGGGPGMRIIRQ